MSRNIPDYIDSWAAKYVFIIHLIIELRECDDGYDYASHCWYGDHVCILYCLGFYRYMLRT